jgi:heptosyltransferase III
MASIYLSKSLWEYKFRKLSYWFSACISYAQLHFSVRLARISQPVVGILLAEHLGDIVAAEPIIAALRIKHPKARIVWIAKGLYQGLLEKHPHIDQVIIENSILASSWICQHSPFTHFYNLHMNELRLDPYFKFSLFNKQAEKIGLTKHNYYERGNLLKGIFDLCDIPYRESLQPKLYLGKEKSWDLPAKYWVIHRKSNGADREWQDKHWIALIDQVIATYDISIVEVGASDGLAIKHPKFISMVGKTSVVEMANIISEAQFFIGIDSGPAHIANAYEIPGLLLLGTYKNFKNHMPFSGSYEQGRAMIYHNPAGSSAGIPFETVWQQLSNLKPIPATQLA